MGEGRNLKGSGDRMGGVTWQMMVMTWVAPEHVASLCLDNTVYPLYFLLCAFSKGQGMLCI